MTPPDSAARSANSDANLRNAAGTRFSFSVANRQYEAWIENQAAGQRVCVSCPLGHLPYSAENRTGRRAVLMLLSAAANLPMARLILTDFQKISLLVSESVSDAGDPKDVLAGAAAAVLKTNPLCELLDSCRAA